MNHLWIAIPITQHYKNVQYSYSYTICREGVTGSSHNSLWQVHGYKIYNILFSFNVIIQEIHSMRLWPVKEILQGKHLIHFVTPEGCSTLFKLYIPHRCLLFVRLFVCSSSLHVYICVVPLHFVSGIKVGPPSPASLLLFCYYSMAYPTLMRI